MSWNKTYSKSLEEKVARLKNVNYELREQLKAKSKEIKKPQKDSSIMNSALVLQRRNARSIVAMLFWEWRKALRKTSKNTVYAEFSNRDYWYLIAKKEAFKQAYKMLKDNA